MGGELRAPVSSRVQGMLATPVEYAPATTTLTTVSTTIVAVDSVNLAITFTAPGSGKVLVRLSLIGRNSTAGSVVAFGLVDHATGLQVGKTRQPGNVANPQFLNMPIPVSGLTAGQSYTFDLAWLVSANTGQIFAGPGNVVALGSPITMEVWAV